MRRKNFTGQKRSLIDFFKKQFLTALHPFGVWFSKNRQKWLSAVAKSVLRVVWCWKLYQKIAWTPRNIFHMHNVPKKCIKHILRAKNEPSQKFLKSNFWPLILGFNSFEEWFSKNRQKLLSAVAKSFLRVVWCCKLYQMIAWTPRRIFHMHNVLEKCVEKILRAKNEASLTFLKSNFWKLFTLSEYDFQKVDKRMRLRFWPVKFFLRIFQAHFACKKCFLESRLSFDIIYSIIQHVEMIWRQLRAIFVDF